MVDDSRQIVRFDPALVEELISHAPSSFRIKARNPQRSIEMGGGNINFATVGGPSFVSDLTRADELERLKI